MDWFKKIPNWIKSGFALVTALVGFILLFQKNYYLVLTVLVGSLLAGLCAGSLYVAFAKRKFRNQHGSAPYRYKKYRGFGLVGVVISILLTAVLLSIPSTRQMVVYAFSGLPAGNPIVLMEENYKPDELTFDLIVSNTSDKPQVLTRIGVTSNFTQPGGIPCTGGATETLLSLGTYQINFPASSGDTSVIMDPPIIISPNQVARFDIALLPQAGDPCLSWTADIKAYAQSTSGYRVFTSSHSVKQHDYYTLLYKRFTTDQLITIVENSKEAPVRARAIKQLAGSDLVILNTGNAIITPTSDKPEEDERQVIQKKYTVFLQALNDHSPYVRLAAISALGSLKEPQAIPSLIDILQHDPDEKIRKECVFALASFSDPRVVVPIGATLLYDQSNDVREAAASRMGEMTDPRVEDYLLRTFQDLRAPESIRAVSIRGLINKNLEIVVPQVIQILQNHPQKLGEGWSIRRAAIDALGRRDLSSNPAVLHLLTKELAQDPDVDFRIEIAEALRGSPSSQEGVLALGRAAQEDPSKDVRVTAIYSLQNIGTELAIEQLKAVAKSQTGGLQQLALKALTELGVTK